MSYHTTDIGRRASDLVDEPLEHCRAIAMAQVYEIGLLHQLVESMALGVPAEHMPDAERLMLDLILDGDETR